MSELPAAGRCLNCGAPLYGSFCAACGQRDVPPHPTARELAGDAWQELSGYDGRIMATIRGLLRPGFLTREYVEGRRAAYLPPVRVYLTVSVLYFVLAASAPENVSGTGSSTISGPGVNIRNTERQDGPILTAAEREELLANIDRSPWIVRPMLRAFASDPAAFRHRMFTVMPRVFFALLPVFAGLVALFYRRRHFPTALVFAAHLHAFAFIAFAIAEASKFTRNEMVADVVSVMCTIAFVIYALRAFRAVFEGRWPVTVAKATAIAFLYLLSSVPAFIVIMLLASWT
ncbi:MAG TPA: DUF3667 domain-containing protein [Vicinamibacterales bacterium]|nr:DUF3667 domain-containing protein [Vicinamibacterales bacterium]